MWKKNTGNITPRVSRAKTGKTMILSKCAICGGEKQWFIKKQEASGILSSLGPKKPVNEVLLLGDILFW